jgi:hypothetical protein
MGKPPIETKKESVNLQIRLRRHQEQERVKTEKTNGSIVGKRTLT